jgi:hypothetical protein
VDPALLAFFMAYIFQVFYGQHITAWTMAILCAVLTSIALCSQVDAGLDEPQAVLTMLNAAYGPYNPAVKGWVAAHEGLTYTFHVLDQRTVSTPYGERLYVLTAGDAPEEAAHATPGLLGAFIGVEHDGGIHTIASARALPFGGWGRAPDTFAFQQFGPDAYFGWIIDSGYTAQGHTSMSKTMLLPYGKKVSERGSLTTCDEDFSLAVDTTSTGVKVYPLIATIKHAGKSRKGRATTVRIPFDGKTFTYRSPKAFSGGC